VVNHSCRQSTSGLQSLEAAGSKYLSVAARKHSGVCSPSERFRAHALRHWRAASCSNYLPVCSPSSGAARNRRCLLTLSAPGECQKGFSQGRNRPISPSPIGHFGNEQSGTYFGKTATSLPSSITCDRQPSRPSFPIGKPGRLQIFRTADYHRPMIVWLIVTVVLLIWNAVYCGIKIVADFRGPKPASGVWGLFALAGVLSMLAMAVVGAGVAVSGI
jgi:hypothetical protein